MWDDAMYRRVPCRASTKGRTGTAIQRRSSRKPLADAAINGDIIERYYVIRPAPCAGLVKPSRRTTSARHW